MSLPDPRLTSFLQQARAALGAAHAAAVEQAMARLLERSTSALRASERDEAREAAATLAGIRSALNPAFVRRLGRAADAASTPSRSGDLDWDALTLVDEAQVETDLARARLAQQIGHAAEWEFRDLAALTQALAAAAHGGPSGRGLDLEPGAIAGALHDSVTDTLADPKARAAVTQALVPGVLQQLPALLRGLVEALKAQGVRPLALSVVDAGPSTRGTSLSSQRDGPASTLSGMAPRDTGASSWGHTGRSALSSLERGSGWGESARSPASDQTLRLLLKRLSALPALPPGSPEGDAPLAAGDASPHGSGGNRPPAAPGPGDADEPPASQGYPPRRTLAAPNLIRLHQAELERAATGALDHLVIEVVGALFDQILSDSRVPPQMARQIARLQLPVLRVTLVDPSFFSSRRHPVRQFINRIASLACAYEQFDTGPGQLLLERVSRLVQDIVEGDFEQIGLYTRTLRELEQHVSQAAQAAVEEQAGAPSLVARKESQLRTQQRYRSQLQAALEPLALPAYLHDFLTQVWSQALLDAAQDGGDAQAQAQTLTRYRAVGRNLVLSIQPKGSTVQRQRFLLQLPGLMRDLAEGVRRIGWPAAAHQTFLDALQPSHALALRSPPMSELDHNLLSRRLDGIFSAPLPLADTAPTLPGPSADEGLAAPVGPALFSEDEARQIGFIPDQPVPSDGPLNGVAPDLEVRADRALDLDLDLDLSAATAGEDSAAARAEPDTGPATLPMALDPQAAAADPVLPLARAAGLDIARPAVPEAPADPARGAGLAEHLRIGFAYEMLLQERWQKVRLSHVSPGRSFFVFTHGHRHQQTLTMTARMVRRICEGGRMRAVESAYLVERASERAREQLAALGRRPDRSAPQARGIGATA